MHSDAGDAPSRAPGSPIRTPPDQRSVDSSPGPIAASHVLHRLLVPRHPPCALTHLHTHNTHQHPPPTRAGRMPGTTFGIKALQQKPDHTVQSISRPRPPPGATRSRCSHPLSSSQTPHGHPDTTPPPTPHPRRHRHPHPRRSADARSETGKQKQVWRTVPAPPRDNSRPHHPRQGERVGPGLFPQDPTACRPPTPAAATPQKGERRAHTRPRPKTEPGGAPQGRPPRGDGAARKGERKQKKCL